MILLFANDCLLSRSCLLEDPSVVCPSSPYQGDLAQKKMVVHLLLVVKTIYGKTTFSAGLYISLDALPGSCSPTTNDIIFQLSP